MNKLLPPPLALLLAAAASASDPLDLYVREKFEGDSCGASCAEGDGCFLKSRAFFVAGSCFNRSDKKASAYGEVSEGVVCRQDFLGMSCDFEENSFGATTAEECRDTWNVDECSESEHMKKLAGWCTLSTAPVGEFATPLLTFKEFKGADACDSSDYTHLLLADEGGACVPLSFPSAEGYVAGSRKVSCDGGVFNAERYESADCSGESQKTYTDGSTDVCPADSAAERVYTNNCGEPTIYCKSSALFGGGDEEAESEKAAVGTADDGPAFEPPAAAGRLAAATGLIVIGTALLSWMA